MIRAKPPWKNVCCQLPNGVSSNIPFCTLLAPSTVTTYAISRWCVGSVLSAGGTVSSDDNLVSYAITK